MFAFPADTLAFLAELSAHNDRAWFERQRDRYQAAYVEAGKEFVVAAAPVLAEIAPDVRAEPRVLGSIFRINRDTRFSADKRPYKDHLDFWFWHGERRTAVSGLYLRIAPAGVIVGAGAHGFDRDRLARFRDAVADPGAGGALAAVTAEIEAAGYDVGGETYARTPRGWAAAPEAERFLRHSALYADRTEPADLALDADRLLPTLAGHWRALAPLHAWVVAHLG